MLLAEEEQRFALVIGIGAYANAPMLESPTRDAQAMAAALGRLGFDVDLALDSDYRQLGGRLREFGHKAADKDLALVYFAGYGLQVDGQNYLIPADARLERSRDLAYEALPLNLFLGEIGQAAKLGIMVLDASRDGPFDDRLVQNSGALPIATQPGLGRVDDSPSDTIVATAARANALAEDGTGEHSIYTGALLEELQAPGVELELFFRRVRDRVMQATNGRQEPYTYGSYGATPIYLSPVPVNHPPVAGIAPPLQLPGNAAATSLGIPMPTDQDGDQLVVQVIGLPVGGTVMVGERGLLIGDYLTVEQLKAASFKPDGSHQGESGSFDYTVSDGHGELVKAAAAVAILSSNRAPTIAVAPVFQAVANERNNRLALPAVSDPDGDALKLRVTALPERGRLRQGTTSLKLGDQLSMPAEPLTFDPENAAPGPAGAIGFTVDDGRGGEASGSVVVAILAPALVARPDEARWRELGARPGEAELRDFLERYPQSPFAAQARRQLAALTEPKPRPAAPKLPAKEPSPAPDTKEASTEPIAKDKPKPATVGPDRRCQSVLERVQLGEPLSGADRALLRSRCAS